MQNLLDLLRRPLWVVAGFSAIVNLLLLVPAIFMMQVFDRVLASQSGETLAMLVFGTAGALLLMLALDYLRSRLQAVAGNLTTELLSPAVTQVAIERAAQQVGKPPLDAMRDVTAVRALFSTQALLALFDAPWIVVYVGVIALAHPLLGLAALVAALVMLGLALANDKLTRKTIENVQRLAGSTQRYLEQSLANAEVAQAMGMSHDLIQHWRRKNDKVVRLQRPLAARGVAMAALTRAFRQAVQVVLLAMGAWLVITGQATPGVMIATTILLGRALSPVEQVVGNWRVLAEARAALQRLAALLAQAGPPTPRMPLPAHKGELVAQGVLYRPPGVDRLLLAGVNLSLAPGESLAIIGPSGAGKSTLLRVLSGVWAPSAGTVRLDGVDVASWPRHELGPHLGYLPQAVELFAGSVAENIARLGKVDADAVLKAAQAAGIHEMILRLPEGYDTMIDPHSALLSPGQRQRIGLARALYGEPRLLLLDEPNANLDGAGELALGETLKALRGRCTVVVVTHRTALTQQVDKLMLLDGGRVVHLGAPDEVNRLLQGGMPRPLPQPATGATA
jgi:PrtD family type I secretion system ABC transporter